jgi:hypothetical protein
MKILYFGSQGLLVCLTAAGLFFSSCFAGTADYPNGDPAQSELQIQELIEQLGSKNDEIKVEAAKKLPLLDEARPALEKALKSGDPEVAKRVQQIINAIDERDAAAWLAKVAALAQLGQVDQLVEQVVYSWQSKRKDAAWEVIGELAFKLINWEKQQFKRCKLEWMLSNGKKSPQPFADIGGLRLQGFQGEEAASEFFFTNGLEHSYLVRAEKIVIKNATGRGILVSATSISVSGEGYGDGIFFANDCVSLRPLGGLVVCDGEFHGQPLNALVIARQGVTLFKLANSVVLSSGPVRWVHNQPSIVNSTIISTSTVEIPAGAKVIDSVIKQNQPDALGPVKFFEVGQAGILVKNEKDAVRIQKVHADMIFAEAGLQAGDIILTLDKTPVKSVDSFRKQLRHSLAVRKQLVFEVRRAEKIVTISVKNKS